MIRLSSEKNIGIRIEKVYICAAQYLLQWFCFSTSGCFWSEVDFFIWGYNVSSCTLQASTWLLIWYLLNFPNIIAVFFLVFFYFCTFFRTHLDQSSQDTSSARTGTNTGWGRSVRLIHTERSFLNSLTNSPITSLTIILKESTLKTFQMVQVQPRKRSNKGLTWKSNHFGHSQSW